MNFLVVFKKLAPKNLGKLDYDATLKNEKKIINMAKKIKNWNFFLDLLQNICQKNEGVHAQMGGPIWVM